jgi:ribosomal protein S17
MEKTHSCNLCSTGLVTFFNYNKHCKTAKHIKNVELDKQQKSLICEYCGKVYKLIQNKNKHTLKCKPIFTEQLNYGNSKMLSDDQFKIIIDSMASLHKSVSTISNNVDDVVEGGKKLLNVLKPCEYIKTKFKNAPHIEKFSNYSLFGDNKNLVSQLLQEHRNKNLRKYVGDIILSAYNKDIASNQSLWNTDYKRKIYLIKEIHIHDSDIEMEEGENEQIITSSWIVDNESKLILSHIIEPIINFIREQINIKIDENIKLCKKNINANMGTANIICMNIEISELQQTIISSEFAQSVILYVTPYFNFNRTIKGKVLNM